MIDIENKRKGRKKGAMVLIGSGHFPVVGVSKLPIMNTSDLIDDWILIERAFGGERSQPHYQLRISSTKSNSWGNDPCAWWTLVILHMLCLCNPKLLTFETMDKISKELYGYIAVFIKTTHDGRQKLNKHTIGLHILYELTRGPQW